MKIPIQIETQDRMLSWDLFEARSLQSGQTEKVITEGISIKLESIEIRKGFGFPEIVDITVFVAEHVALPIAVGMLSRYLYDKLKDKRETKIEINYLYVEINAEKIENAILSIVQKNEDKAQNEV